MVIQKFNKLIRNKWVWGVFAIIVGGAFAFDFLIDDLMQDGRESASEDSGRAGTLSGKAVDAETFLAIAEDVRGIGRQRDWQRKASEVNQMAWENYAALEVAARAGLEATDAEVRSMISQDPSFQANGGFSFQLYQRLLREIGTSPERFEASVKRQLTMMRLGQTMLGSAAWASPMELDQAIADMTDTFTVKVARFAQTKAEADAVKLDEAGLKRWYDDNVKSLALPERVKIRYVRYDATDKKILAKMVVTEDEMRDHYDVTVDKYTSTDTNGVEQVKKFEEVKGEIEKELRQLAAVQYFETNLTARAYGVKAAKGASRLDEIAKEDGLKVAVSDWFAPAGGYSEGFMRPTGAILPGAESLAEVVAELDSDSEDLRYGVVTSKRAVWLIEKAATSAKHTPDFAEAKSAIRNRALKAAKAEAFKNKIEKIAKGGAKAVLAATKDVSTNLTFVVSDLRQGDMVFPDQYSVARATRQLKAGEVSEFTLTGEGAALLVICEERKTGEAAKAMVLRSQIRDELSTLQLRELPELWRKWNLKRLGFEPGEISSITESEDEE